MEYIFRLVIFILSTVLGLEPADFLGRPHGVGIGTQYGQAGDIWAMQALACAPTKHIDSSIHVCAHRTLPCGTILGIETVRTKRLSWCVVMDRGPYGAMINNDDGTARWGLKIKSSDPGRWRGILDMSPAVTHSMLHRGMEPIKYWILLVKHPKKPHTIG